MFNDASSPVSLLHSRRSGKARDMVAPGPDATQLDQILRAAVRVPDHGKLAPWRFVVVGADQRAALAALLLRAYIDEKPEAGKLERAALDQFARQAPTLIVALSSPVTTSKIPLWEQQLTVGAACMNLLTAAHALGFVGNWLTGWPAYSDTVRDAFGGPEDRIAGFFFIGTPARPLEERPRPEFNAVVCDWSPEIRG
jgi:nitroreductase